jgi:hypothetical protein
MIRPNRCKWWTEFAHMAMRDEHRKSEQSDEEIKTDDDADRHACSGMRCMGLADGIGSGHCGPSKYRQSARGENWNSATN